MFARACEAIDLLAILEADRDATRFRLPDDGFHALAMATAGDDNAIKRTARGESFFDGMKSSHPVHDFTGVVQCGASVADRWAQQACARTEINRYIALVDADGGDGVGGYGFASAYGVYAFIRFRF